MFSPLEHPKLAAEKIEQWSTKRILKHHSRKISSQISSHCNTFVELERLTAPFGILCVFQALQNIALDGSVLAFPAVLRKCEGLGVPLRDDRKSFMPRKVELAESDEI